AAAGSDLRHRKSGQGFCTERHLARRRKPAASEPAAVAGAQFLHCAAGHLPVAELSASTICAAPPAPTVSPAEGHAATTTPVEVDIFGTSKNNRTFAPDALASVGNTQPHENRQPDTTINICSRSWASSCRAIEGRRGAATMMPSRQLYSTFEHVCERGDRFYLGFTPRRVIYY